MKNEKTREEVVAEREAKKKAKMMAKKKLNSTATTPADAVKPEAPATLKPAAKEAQPQPQHVPATSSVGLPVPSTKGKKNEGRKAKKSEPSVDVQSPKTESPKVVTSNMNNSPTQKTPTDPNKPVTQTHQQVPVTLAKETKSTPVRPTEGKENNKGKDLNNAELVGGDSSKVENLSKAELKAARRLKQELQRAAKSGQLNAKPAKSAAESLPLREVQDKTSDKKVGLTSKVTVSVKDVELKKNVKLKAAIGLHKVKLFNHLYSDEELSINESFSHLHPAIISLGIQFANRIIVGSNARCFSLMNALKQVIEDYTTPQQKEFARGLESCLKPCMAFLQRCRPLAVSMTNAMKHLKWQMTQLPNDVTDIEAKKKLQEAIDTYLRDQIDVAAQAICITVQKKISDGDVILTYGCSSLVQRILIEAHDNGTKFRVVIVDARPLCEGLQLLHRLGQHGIRCSYVLIGAASCMMREATKVLLGTHALLANGYVMSRAGSSQVALLAHSYNVPVLVCCETHKFCERVQTDALVHNEIGDPDALVPCRATGDIKPLANWRSVANLTPLNLTYDVTPPDLVTAVVTELAILPCTSVPVILRIKPTDSH